MSDVLDEAARDRRFTPPPRAYPHTHRVQPVAHDIRPSGKVGGDIRYRSQCLICGQTPDEIRASDDKSLPRYRLFHIDLGEGVEIAVSIWLDGHAELAVRNQTWGPPLPMTERPPHDGGHA